MTMLTDRDDFRHDFSGLYSRESIFYNLLLPADGRFEQSGRVQGTLRVAGRTIPFDTTAHRDHSWGTRDWSSLHHWKWISGQGGPGPGAPEGTVLTFNAFKGLALGQVDINGY